MLAAVKGIVKGNTILIEDEDIREYEGTEAIVTLLDFPDRRKQKKSIDWDKYVIPNSKRGKDVEAYMREMREDDRI